MPVLLVQVLRVPRVVERARLQPRRLEFLQELVVGDQVRELDDGVRVVRARVFDHAPGGLDFLGDVAAGIKDFQVLLPRDAPRDKQGADSLITRTEHALDRRAQICRRQIGGGLDQGFFPREDSPFASGSAD